jgi:probable HAF family extracellular repeat protein
MAAAVLVVACAAPATAGMYTFTNINTPPSVIGSYAFGINNNGTILGYSEAPAAFANALEPFIDTGGSFTFLNNPATSYTAGFGINNANQVVGTYILANDPNGISHAFLYSNGNYQTIDPPVDPMQLFASADAINNSGQIVVNNIGYSSTNFLYSNGQFTPVPAIPSTGIANGINDAGTIVGTTFDSTNVPHGFMLNGGQLTQLDDPNAGTAPFFNGTQAYAINNHGTIVGSYSDANNNTHGFIYQNGVFTTLDDPLADTWDSLRPFTDNGTYIAGINDQGQIVGYYFYMVPGGNPDILSQAFLATPAPEPGSLALAVIGGILATGWRVRRRKELTQ